MLARAVRPFSDPTVENPRRKSCFGGINKWHKENYTKTWQPGLEPTVRSGFPISGFLIVGSSPGCRVFQCTLMSVTPMDAVSQVPRDLWT